MSEYPNYSYSPELKTYHIVFGTYGARIPGSAIARTRHGGRTIKPSLALEMHTLETMLKTIVTLDVPMRQIAAQAMRAEARRRDWQIHALNVRTNHVHVLLTLDANVDSVNIIAGLKYASTVALHAAGYYTTQNIWSDKGYASPIGTAGYFRRAYDYVLEQNKYKPK